MKRFLAVILATLMLCASVLTASASLYFTVIDDTFAQATRTYIHGNVGTRRDTSLSIVAQVYKYSSVADDYMRSVKFTTSAANDHELQLYEDYNLNSKDKVVFTFTAGGESTTETCYVR